MNHRIAILVLILAALLAACSAGVLPADGDRIPWGQAVELLNRGVVTGVFQLHNLEVTLSLENGASVHTTEPHIDAIFEVIEACGAPCAEMMIATE